VSCIGCANCQEPFCESCYTSVVYGYNNLSLKPSFPYPIDIFEIFQNNPDLLDLNEFPLIEKYTTRLHRYNSLIPNTGPSNCPSCDKSISHPEV
jgi:hypothetical protein